MEANKPRTCEPVSCWIPQRHHHHCPEQAGVKWVAASGGNVPEGAFQGGNEGDNKVYVIRAEFRGNSTPGKLVSGEKVAYVAWGGVAHEEENYEVLVLDAGTSVSWERDILGGVCNNGVVGGVENGKNIYIGRAEHEGSLVVGKVHPTYGKLYIPYGGKEVEYEEYDVLVLNN